MAYSDQDREQRSQRYRADLLELVRLRSTERPRSNGARPRPSSEPSDADAHRRNSPDPSILPATAALDPKGFSHDRFQETSHPQLRRKGENETTRLAQDITPDRPRREQYSRRTINLKLTAGLSLGTPSPAREFSLWMARMSAAARLWRIAWLDHFEVDAVNALFDQLVDGASVRLEVTVGRTTSPR